MLLILEAKSFISFAKAKTALKLTLPVRSKLINKLAVLLCTYFPFLLDKKIVFLRMIIYCINVSLIMNCTLASAYLSMQRIISGDLVSQCSLQSFAGLTGHGPITAVESPQGPLKSVVLPKKM